MRMCAFQGQLYVGGVTSAGGQAVSGLARWDGQNWSQVPGIEGNGVDQMIVFDDGAGGGPALIADGYIGSVEGQTTHGWAKFDGQHWHPMPGTCAPPGFDSGMVVFNEDPRGPSLFIPSGGNAYNVGQFVACSPRTCYANCDNSTAEPRLNVNDFICFMNRFAAVVRPPGPSRDPYADCNQDGQFNIADFQCFINKFAAGCP
jgi:hypothetical protein